MKTDRYTKTVLTIIAASLVILIVQNSSFIPQVNATESQLYHPMIPVNEDGSIKVSLSPEQYINVKVIGIETSDHANVNIKGVAGKQIDKFVPVKHMQ